MDRNSTEYESCIRILKEELIIAMGCTEPIALAYAAAKCRAVLGALPEHVEIHASGSIIKNVKSVIVPNTGALKGMKAAAAAGIIAGKAEKELEVLAEVKEEEKSRMKEYLDEADIELFYLDSPLVFDIIVKESAGSDHAVVRIANFHTNIVSIEKNGEKLLDIPVESESEEGLTDRSFLTMENIWDFVNTCDIEDIRPIIKRQIDCNTAISAEGIKNNYGANIGKVLIKTHGNDVRTRAAAMAAAGSDARMNGCEMPVVINSGSGNQGITCSVPVIEYAKEYNVCEETLYRALVLSNLTTIYQKNDIGRLSAFCGAVSAGAAAGAGIAYIKGGSYKDVVHTIVNALAVVSGMVCDGAKASCAAKIAMAVNCGILGYEMYQCGQQFVGGDGLVIKGVDNTIHNIGRLGREGMRKTNDEIIRMMIE